MLNQIYFRANGSVAAGTNEGVQELYLDDIFYTRCENPNTSEVVWYLPKKQGGYVIAYDDLPWVRAESEAVEKAATRRELENKRVIADEAEKARREKLAAEKAAAHPFASTLVAGYEIKLRPSCTDRSQWKFVKPSVCSSGGLRLVLINERGETASYGIDSVVCE